MTNINNKQITNQKQATGQKINCKSKTVNVFPSTHKCLNKPKLSKNTILNKPKTSQNKRFGVNLSKPIPKTKTDSYDQKTRLSQSELYKVKLNEMLDKIYNPTHFLSVRLPSNLESPDELHSRTHLRMIMKVFEKTLLGRHWNKHHLPFICFAELGSGTDWHYHILLNQGKFSDQELQNAILKTTITLRLPSYCLRLDKIDCLEDKVKDYCHKELEVYWNGKANSDRFILSADLFYLPYKKD